MSLLLPHEVFLKSIDPNCDGYPPMVPEYALRALEDGSGQNFGYDLEKWANWLDKNIEKFYGGNLSEDQLKLLKYNKDTFK